MSAIGTSSAGTSSEVIVPSALTPAVIEQLRERALGSLYFFIKGVLGFDWLVPHIHMPLCQLLEDPKNNRLRIVIPRGWLKTTICSIGYPLWRACRNHNIRCLLVQNTHTNAVAKNLSIKSVVEGEKDSLFKVIFPEIRPGYPWKGESLCIERERSFPEATFEAAGTRTKVTSRHYDLIIEDDTVAPDLDDLSENVLIPTKADVEQAIGYHRLVTPLLTDQKRQIIVVGTRWFERDLLSWISDMEPHYKSYERACRELSNGEGSECGDITYPERFDAETLKKLKIAVGPYSFSCLYLNKPIRSDDMMFLQDWIQFYDTEPQDLLTYTTVDPGGDPEETKGESDWSVVITAGKDIRTGKIYILDYWRQKANPGSLIQAIFDHVARWHPLKVGFESVAQAKTFLYFIKEKMRQDNRYFILEGLHPGIRSKPDRIRGLQPIFGALCVFMRPHMHELVNELLAFPYGAHDDLCDTLAMQLQMWAETTTTREVGEMSEEDDPFSLTDALNRIRGRDKMPAGSVYDVYDHEPVLQF